MTKTSHSLISSALLMNFDASIGLLLGLKDEKKRRKAVLLLLELWADRVPPRQVSGMMTGNSKPSAGQGRQGEQKVVPKHDKKNNQPEDFDIDMEDPETAKAAVAIQSQFRKYQKKKQDVKS
ncbi:hypothetical protein WMY93_016843 [Mugilogobius chulae]|uniref:Purkinje cell protein 4 n=1 Tax=Mugilogobius chulae TaxID=88201 RepID=A0AAW0NTH3_9GOBI